MREIENRRSAWMSGVPGFHSFRTLGWLWALGWVAWLWAAPALAGGFQEIGDDSWPLFEGFSYHETWRSLGNDGGLYAPVTHLGTARGYVFGAVWPREPRRFASSAPAVEQGQDFWIVELGAFNDRVERYDTAERWRARLVELGVPDPSELRHVETYRGLSSRLFGPWRYLIGWAVAWIGGLVGLVVLVRRFIGPPLEVSRERWRREILES